MSGNLTEITCVRCGHTWRKDLAPLEEADQTLYRGKVQQKSYRVRCPRCGTHNVVTVESEEGESE